ncbi:CapA family protein [Luteipulveratus sp. YIM 133132]|uniref:CapA family protein n=1 Tax=Luteipulveratus flavus TaxID=3031728 RepID=UPI0023B1FDB3|nr:CapA family protein [Luteipulveratus sp. YIM 133132]MDE9367658.1 CapA family protein [Luteipulveratus sp. YIM 133132]
MRVGGPVLAAVVTAALVACSTGDDEGAKPDPRPNAPSGSSQASGSTDAKSPTTVTVTGSGDILIHVPVAKNARANAKASGRGEYDFGPMFADVRPVLSAADVSICHQETPISSTNENLSRPGSLVYNVPKEIARDLKGAGFDGCETASNHTWDQGARGITSTRDQLTAAGLKVAGPTTSASDPGMPAVYEAKGVRIANLSYTYTILNQSSPNTDLPPGAPNLKRYLWPARGAAGIIADAKKAKDDGADLVVVSIHWGTEYVPQPTKDQRSLATSLLESPYVDGIFGAHAHLVQPCTTVNGKTAFFGLGNFLSNQGKGQAGTLSDTNADGVIAELTFTRSEDGRWTQRASYQPTMVDIPGKHVIRLSSESTNPTSFKRTTTTMNRLGTCKATPVDGG